MTSLRPLAVVFFLLYTAAAFAQMSKCVTPDGKVSYTDGDCPSSAKRNSVDISDNRYDASADRERIMRDSEARSLLEQGQNRAAPDRGANTGRAVDQAACDRALREAQIEARSARRNLPAMLAANRAVEARCNLPRRPSAPAASGQNDNRAPPIIASCDPGGCWDTNGKRYNGTGTTFFGPAGPCTKAGTTLICP